MKATLQHRGRALGRMMVCAGGVGPIPFLLLGDSHAAFCLGSPRTLELWPPHTCYIFPCFCCQSAKLRSGPDGTGTEAMNWAQMLLLQVSL